MAKTPEQLLDDASAWWSTEIIDIHPGKIAIRGYPIQELIGRVRFPDMIWLMLRGDLPSRSRAISSKRRWCPVWTTGRMRRRSRLRGWP
jgi:citrate synthase